MPTIKEPSQELKNECKTRIILARTALVLRFPFFGILASKLSLVENNTWCRTMATDGRHLYYNTEFVMGMQDPDDRIAYTKLLKEALPDITDEQIENTLNGLTDNNIIAVICHEILHCAYNHFLRKGSRNHQKWNKAADYAINQILVRDKIGEIQDTWLFDPRFDKMSAEQIYNILAEEKSDGGGDSVDQHGDGGAGDEESDGKSRGKVGDFMRPSVSKEDMEKYMDDFQSSMIGAASADKCPEEIRKMVNKFNNPQIDWRTKLDRTLRSWIRSDCTFMSPSRRSWSQGVIFPGLKVEQEIDVCIAIDTSGSMSLEMLQDFISEIYGITCQFTQFKIKILCFDTSVHNPVDFDPHNVEKLLEYNVAGGGGTTFPVVWDYMKEIEYRPNQLIMFTDGQPWDSWGDEHYCNTLFVIHSYDVTAPFGETIPYQFKNKQ